MKPFKSFQSTAVVLGINNIDTDQIIPARFLKVTDKAGLGANAFCDWRYLGDGAPNPEFALNQPAARGSQILIAGDNFGCGSSREHAPWALLDYGFRVVISSSIADIFRNNSLKNGLLPIVVDPKIHAALLESGGKQISVDLEAQTLSVAGGVSTSFSIEPFARYCMINGLDQLDYLLKHSDEISKYEESVR